MHSVDRSSVQEILFFICGPAPNGDEIPGVLNEVVRVLPWVLVIPAASHQLATSHHLRSVVTWRNRDNGRSDPTSTQVSKVYLGSMSRDVRYTTVLIGWNPATSSLPPRIWTRIRGRYWSTKIDDISLWPLLSTIIADPDPHYMSCWICSRCSVYDTMYILNFIKSPFETKLCFWLIRTLLIIKFEMVTNDEKSKRILHFFRRDASFPAMESKYCFFSMLDPDPH